MGTRPLAHPTRDHRFTTDVPVDEVAHHIWHMTTLLSSALAQELPPDAERRLAAALADLESVTPRVATVPRPRRRGDG